MPTDPVRAKLKLLATTAAAFAGGIALATGMDWTAGSHAAVLQTTEQPAAREVRPVAELNDAFISIAESVTPAVVAIETEQAPRQRNRRGGEGEEGGPFSFPFPDGREGPQAPRGASGSGFIISPEGHIITNNHVVAEALQITVVLSDNRQLPAQLVGRDPLTDIAVIKIEGGGFPAVRLGRSDQVRIGEWVLAIGNPLDLGTTVTAGIVSAQGRSLQNLIGSAAGGSRWAIEDFVQTDAPINPGNSGGPLVNLRGEVVGVNSAIASPTGFYSGYGFAVPIDLARRVADDLIRYGRTRRPALGVQLTPVTPEDAEVYGLERIEGVVAQDFPEDSPARAAGMQPGDVIVAVDGQRVQRVGQFQRLVASRRPGETVRLDLVRFGARRSVNVRLTEAPANAAPEQTDPQAARPAQPPLLGIGVGPVASELAQQRGIPAGQGVQVTEVADFSAAARYGLARGTVILAVDGQAVGDVAGFRRAVERRRAGDVVSLRVVFPTGERGILNVRMPGV